MLFLLGEALESYYGPFRLLTSHIFLASAAIVLSGLGSWILLPRFTARLPRDRGREFAVANEAAVGKPTSAGVVFVIIYLVVAVLTVPWSTEHAGVLVLVLFAMLAGYWDDRRDLSEYTLAALDTVLSFGAAMLLCRAGVQIWLPFTADPLMVSGWICVPVATGLIWLAINATNCTDGVDGLAGSLSSLALVTLGGMLYFVLGHEDISSYLLLPHYVEGASWAISAFTMVGCLIGYLWYNAYPSQLLMGDAGSRAVGLLTGVLVIASGNPFMLFIVSGVLLVNGGTGLMKVALLRFARIGIFKNVRFPLHDHVRHHSGWSNSQVVVRFALLQLTITMVFVVALVKIR